MQEANRLKQLYEEALRHPAGIALVHWMHAYYAAANFDGLRVMLWLARAIAALDTTITVDRQLRGLGEALQEGLDAAVGRVGAAGKRPNYMRRCKSSTTPGSDSPRPGRRRSTARRSSLCNRPDGRDGVTEQPPTVTRANRERQIGLCPTRPQLFTNASMAR
jgi:hypothetical protein